MNREDNNLIPISGPGSRQTVNCSECGIEGSISKKYGKSSSGFLFVCGQDYPRSNYDEIKVWRRYENNLCYNCNFLTIEVVEDEL